MNPSLATLICFVGIAGLFYLDRDKTVQTSKALWLPFIYLWIMGSRAVSTWLGLNEPGVGKSQIDGSPIDAAVLGFLLLCALIVLTKRGKRTLLLLRANWPILAYFLYCLISVAWSFHPDVAFKRWIKAIGDLAMVLVIVTEPDLRNALRHLFSRLGFLFFPTSVLLIKYFPDLGRVYDPFGLEQDAGVSSGKNMLGVMLLVISLGTLWQLITLLRDKGRPNRRRHLLAQGALLVFGIALLSVAHSATSIACFVLGSGLIFATGLRAIRSRAARVHLLCLAIFLGGGLALLSGGETGAANALGRESNLSGRTDIWAAVLASSPNPIVGAGFESYWISPTVLVFRRILKDEGWWHPDYLNEAHNGYIEVYLNLGWVGVGLISLILISGYRRAIAAFRLNASIGGLMLAYIIVAAFYNITEAGFRMLDLMWIFLLLAIVSASAVVTGLVDRETPRILGLRGGTASRTPAGNKFILKGKTA